jgi:hypothetical protein
MATGRVSILDAGFAQRYAVVTRERLGRKLTGPSGFLRDFKLLADDSFGAGLASAAAEITHASSIWSESLPCCDTAFVKQFRSWDGSTRLLVLPAARIGQANMLPAPVQRALANALRRGAASAIAVQMVEPEPPLIVIAAASRDAALKALTALMQEQELSTRTWVPSVQ